MLMGLIRPTSKSPAVESTPGRQTSRVVNLVDCCTGVGSVSGLDN